MRLCGTIREWFTTPANQEVNPYASPQMVISEDPSVLPKRSRRGQRVLPSTRSAYTQLIEEARQRGSRDPFPARFPWQRDVFFRQLMQTALETHYEQPQLLTLSTGTVPDFCCEAETVSTMQQFLHQNFMQVLIFSSPDKTPFPLWKMVEANPNAEVRHIPLKRIEEVRNQLSQFATISNRAFVFCAAHAPTDLSTYMGRDDYQPEVPMRIEFNSPGRAKLLEQNFTSFWELSRSGAGD